MLKHVLKAGSPRTEFPRATIQKVDSIQKIGGRMTKLAQSIQFSLLTTKRDLNPVARLEQRRARDVPIGRGRGTPHTTIRPDHVVTGE